MKLEKERIYQFHERLSSLSITRIDSIINTLQELLEYMASCEYNPNADWLKDAAIDCKNEFTKQLPKWKNKVNLSEEEFKTYRHFKDRVLRAFHTIQV